MQLQRFFKGKDNFFYLKVFLVLLGVLIVFSLIIRAVLLVRYSSFTTPSFSVLVLTQDAHLIAVDKKNNLLSIGTWKSRGADLAKNTRLINEITLAAPIESELILGSDDTYSPPVSLHFLSLIEILKIELMNSDAHFIGLNPYDLLKIYFAAKGVSNTNIQEGNFPDTENDTQLFQYFKDEGIINDKVSIAVVNATDENGLGGRVAQMLENGGYNIVSITSDDPVLHSHIIYRLPFNTTLAHLFRVIPFPSAFKNETAISDVTIILGKDYNKIQ